MLCEMILTCNPLPCNCFRNLPEHRFALILTYLLQIKGCEEIIVPTLTRGSRPHYQTALLKIEASITDETSGFKRSATHNTKRFQNSDYELHFQGPKTYKPGFNFKIKVEFHKLVVL